MEEIDLADLLRHLRAANRETEWVEFKLNDDEPAEIGEYVSALANSAALVGKRFGYIIWGISNITHEVIGTKVRLSTKKIGNEELENWISHQLSPRVHFVIHEGEIDGKLVSLIEVPAASHTPVRFRDFEYIRVGSIKKKLRDHPEKERELWRLLERRDWETEAAAVHVPSADVLSMLDYPAYFDLLKRPLPENRTSIITALADDKLIEFDRAGDTFNITNLGAILFARDLSRFSHLSRKAVRLVVYTDADRTSTLREQVGQRGYASGFGRLVNYINDLLPASEQLVTPFRTERRYPEIAIRELVANALIHQDFRIPGTGPMIEIFAKRIEITNPGTPLIDTERFLDLPPQSRNEKLGALMRRMNICEERGSGIDKVITAAEKHLLPAPKFEVINNHTKVTLFGPRKLSEMEKDERVLACYQHACLRYVSHSPMTNTSLRKRFGIDDKNYSMVSRIIKETIEAGQIKPRDPDSKSKKLAKYVPFWV
ncbi:MAG TPA: ATP-binding protein [Thermoanaerobaculia bacterium]|nr:ATP-binding protein [Thermoanaerobaculia bacterium]